MYIVIGLALGLILAGIVMAWAGTKGLPPGMLATVLYWTGCILIVVGLILLLTPVLVYLNAQLRAALGLT